MNKVLPNQSIIQTTLLKFTLSIFAFILIFIFIFQQNFWDKEELRLKYQLLTTAQEVRSEIQSQSNLIQKIEGIEVNDQVSTVQKKQEIKELIEPLLSKHPNNSNSIAFYDIQLGLVSNFNDKELDLPVSSILSTLEKDNQIREIDLVSLNIISLPLYQEGSLRGYIWTYATDFKLSLESFFKITFFTILALSFSALMMLLIRKHLKRIERYLDHFSQAIVDHKSGYDCDIDKLPELKPVLNKIIVYTEELERINIELETSKQKIVHIMQGISDGFLSLDKNWVLTFINPVMAKVINQSEKELLGRTIFEISPQFKESISYQKMQQAISESIAMHWEHVMETLQDKVSVNTYECHAYPFSEGLSIFVRDVTELRKQQKEFSRLERLNLLGQLAAGISHEIRNPLTTVKGLLQFLGIKPKYTEEKDHFDLMISEIDRANSIITDFLSLTKTNLDSTQSHNINDIIHRVYPMLQADAVNNNKEVILALNPLPVLLLNENEIRQLLLNLVRNGLEVTPEQGAVTIETYEQEGKVFLAIIDQGCGIPEEIQGKIGTPFFTTKDTGTGLGVAICMGIVQRHNADLKFESGKSGTTFQVIFNIG
ncbi:two-component system sensor histidine kinase NtrB [Desulfitobacterium sp.]|uniref:two-component system sensor histidine kinase NtrB n=1 Tax=Desulfitobacterium sp. TaxID=49981 RepID=UPI002C3232B9|nr:ATP-binding protein [Desulfitobacterium sp.]HVJ49414.1 ATP-binding protein [Desulfitobacterium sp.]